jgi:hypothetical protein
MTSYAFGVRGFLLNLQSLCPVYRQVDATLEATDTGMYASFSRRKLKPPPIGIGTRSKASAFSLLSLR